MLSQNARSVNAGLCWSGTYIDIAGGENHNPRGKVDSSDGYVTMNLDSSNAKLGWAWVGLALALGLHVADEALTGFLSIYNPTVMAARQRWSWFPMPTFTFETWLVGLIAAVVVLLVLSPMAFRNVRWIRPVGYLVSVLMILNAIGHTVATILGRTFAGIRFARPAPGFYSSPVMLTAAVYLLVQLRKNFPVVKAQAIGSGR